MKADGDAAVSQIDLRAAHIVISLSKIRNRDWSYTRHMICINNQCCQMHQHPGATFMLSGATVPGNITGEHDAIG